jgi:hypothetical protein
VTSDRRADSHDLLVPFPSELMRIWPISTRVNKPDNDDPGILDALESALVLQAWPHELTVFAFDLLHRDGVDLRPLSLSRRKDLLTRLVRRSKVNSLQLIASFPRRRQVARPRLSACGSRVSCRSGERRPTTQGSAGTGARSWRERTGSGGRCLSGASPPATSLSCLVLSPMTYVLGSLLLTTFLEG